jgi:O-methyltransferase involved in polyketide biosynthesis
LPAVEPGKPSLSALEVTAYRAIGAKHPDPAIRNGDSLAERFLEPDERAILKKGRHLRRWARQSRVACTRRRTPDAGVRSRFSADAGIQEESRPRALGSLPSHVTYVPIDFTKEDPGTVLAGAGYDRALETIFVWEGVTFYLPEEAVDATLRFVASNAAPGSRIVFDYSRSTRTGR